MYGSITVQELLLNIKLNVNKYVATSLFTENFLLSRINQAYNRVYRYRQWTWNKVVETLTSGSATDSFTLTYRSQSFYSLKDGDGNTYTRVEQFTDLDTPSNYYEYKVSGTTITLSKEVEEINVVYRRFPTASTSDNLTAEIDVPPEFEEVVENIAIYRILHVWLGEGVAQMAGNFKQDIAEALNDLAKMDTYESTAKKVVSARRDANGNIV